MGLTEAFVADANPDKLNLSVGVYRDADGKTPILRAVREAKRRLLETETVQGYLPIDGLPDYREHVRRLIFADRIDPDRIAVLQTPGGTGALRVAADFLADQFAAIRIWMPSPTWANHPSVFAAAGVGTDTYRYLADDRTSLDFAGMVEDLKTKPAAGDVVLLHACCHNPTGVDPTSEQWRELAEVLQDRQLLPLIDFAYQGFAHGLDEDANAVRVILDAVDEALVCSSFSKNFSLYGERVGAMSLVAATGEAARASQSQLKRVVRSNYSNPPKHGAAVVATVLDDAELTQIWQAELTEMRQRIANLRRQFVETMKSTQGGHDFSFLLQQNGMFSFSGLTPMQVDELKNKHSIYIVNSGRINVAGMSEQRMAWLCEKIAAVL